MACRGLKLHLDGMYGISYFVMAYLRLNKFAMALKELFQARSARDHLFKVALRASFSTWAVGEGSGGMGDVVALVNSSWEATAMLGMKRMAAASSSRESPAEMLRKKEEATRKPNSRTYMAKRVVMARCGTGTTRHGGA
jgi:hypothetical protein